MSCFCQSSPLCADSLASLPLTLTARSRSGSGSVHKEDLEKTLIKSGISLREGQLEAAIEELDPTGKDEVISPCVLVCGEHSLQRPLFILLDLAAAATPDLRTRAQVDFSHFAAWMMSPSKLAVELRHHWKSNILGGNAFDELVDDDELAMCASLRLATLRCHSCRDTSLPKAKQVKVLRLHASSAAEPPVLVRAYISLRRFCSLQEKPPVRRIFSVVLCGRERRWQCKHDVQHMDYDGRTRDVQGGTVGFYCRAGVC